MRPHRRSLRRPGRLVPAAARHLRGRVVVLPPRGLMPWHSTGRREEVVIMVAGAVRLEVLDGAQRVRASELRRGHCVFLPQRTVHRLVNPSRHPARYLYLTA